jgi:hypothetical protein
VCRLREDFINFDELLKIAKSATAESAGRHWLREDLYER